MPPPEAPPHTTPPGSAWPRSARYSSARPGSPGTARPGSAPARPGSARPGSAQSHGTLEAFLPNAPPYTLMCLPPLTCSLPVAPPFRARLGKYVIFSITSPLTPPTRPRPTPFGGNTGRDTWREHGGVAHLGPARLGPARLGPAQLDPAWLARHGPARLGHGSARLGPARLGPVTWDTRGFFSPGARGGAGGGRGLLDVPPT